MKTLCGYQLREVSSTPSHTSLWTFNGEGIKINLWHYHDTFTWDIHLEGLGFDVRAIGNNEKEVSDNFRAALQRSQQVTSKLLSSDDTKHQEPVSNASH